MKKILLSMILVAVCHGLTLGAPDMKFFRKAADKVWKMRPDLFDPYREIPDSIKAEASAVIIGEYNYINADYQAFEDARGAESRSESTVFTRRLIKLLDMKAVEDLSKHEFGGKKELGIKFRKNISESNQAFGARIYKPDGTVKEVDISKAFVIDEGKKGGDGKTIKQIIDIPGLEPGDVLEYFTYQENKARELDLPASVVRINNEYPTLDVVVEGIFDPHLTVEFRGYNGAPKLETGVNEQRDNTVWLRRNDLPVITDRRFVNTMREVPFYTFYILNNTSPYRYYPKYSRMGGLYQDPLPGTIFRDISLGLAAANYDTSNVPRNARKIIGDYRKHHPEATTEHLIDMAWAAVNYANLTDSDESNSDYWVAMMFCDILRKEKLAEDAGVAFINPMTDVPTNEILNWRQPDFGALVGDRLYIGNTLDSFLPGELPAAYQGQMCASYPGKREKLQDFTMPTIITTPISKASDNQVTVKSEIKIDGSDAITSNEVTMTGAQKDLSSDFITGSEWLSRQEDYLGIEANKRYKKLKPLDKEELDKNLKESTLDLYTDLITPDKAEISDVVINNYGLTPDDPKFSINFNAKVAEACAAAGDELLFKIGMFSGDYHRMEGNQRERMTNITMKCATQENLSVTLHIPDGYEVDENSLKELSRNVQTPVGRFITGTKLGADGKTLTLMVRSQIARPIFNISAWPAVLELTDAQADFADAVVVLKKKG